MNVQRVNLSKEKLFHTSEMLVLAVLLLCFMDFYLYSLHLMVIAFALLFVLKGRIAAVRSVLPSLIFTVVLCIFWSAEFFSPSTIVKRLVWPAAFLLGYNLIRPVGTDINKIARAEKKANVCIVIAVVGFLIHVVLNTGINLGASTTDRNTLDFWSKEIRAATGQAALFCIPTAWSIASIIKETGFVRRLPAIAALVLMLYYNLTLGGRTLIYSIAIITAVALFFLLRHQGMATEKRNAVIVIAIFAIVAIIVYHFNIWGTRSLIEESTLFVRMFGADRKMMSTDVRWERKQQYFQYMWNYPWGGNNLLQIAGGYAHDIFLDTYDETSIFGFLAVFAILWDSVSKLRKVLRKRSLHFHTKLLLLCVYLSIFIIFAVEPVFAGMPWVLMMHCFVHGMVTALDRYVAVNDIAF